MLSNPTLYRIATTGVSTALEALPHFAIYNHLNACDRHREVPTVSFFHSAKTSTSKRSFAPR